MSQYLKLLSDLVNVDSGTGDREGIAKVFSIIEPRLRQLGCTVERLIGKDGSTHFYAHRGQGNRILLSAHLDTVFPSGTAQKRPFQIEGDLVRGPGVSDCKSGVVTIIGALEKLEQLGWPDCEVSCLFNTDEEISSPGSRGIIEELARGAKAVLVVEPAEGDNLTVARKGIGRLKLEVFGKAAHSGSNYQDGSNAILELAHKIIAVQKLTDFETGVTFNVGVVQGGARPNIIPDYAAVEIDLRVKTVGQDQSAIRKLELIAQDLQVAGCTARLSGGLTRPPMEATPASLHLFDICEKAARNLGVPLGKVYSGGGSDANFAAALGIPTLDGLGPIGGGHHSDQEYMVISSLEQRIELLAAILKSLPAEL